MKNTDLIPIGSNIYKHDKLKRKFSFLKKFVCFSLILALFYMSYVNFDKIKSFVSNLAIDFESQQDSITEENNEDNQQNETSDNLKEEFASQIPENANKIHSVASSFSCINNNSTLDIDLEFLNEALPQISETYDKYGKNAPHVLIIHSSCQEAYSNGEYYFVNDNFYSSSNNVGDIGKLICDILNENHINTIHINQIFGTGGIYNSREHFESTINEALIKYPSIKVILDISRGYIINDDLSMNKVVIELNEKSVSQISLTVGSDTKKGEIYYKNLNLANAILRESNNLVYDITVAPFKLSQDIEPLFLKVDIGAYSNSFEEASFSAIELAKIICSLLNESWQNFNRIIFNNTAIMLIKICYWLTFYVLCIL